MSLFFNLLKQLGTSAISYSYGSIDLSASHPVEFLDNQTQFLSDVIYLGTPRQLSVLLGQAYFQPGTIILLGQCQTSVLHQNPLASDITYVETTLPIYRLYNLLQDVLKNRISPSAVTLPAAWENTWQNLLLESNLTRQKVISQLCLLVPSDMKLERVRLLLVDFDLTLATPFRLSALKKGLERVFSRSSVFLYGAYMIVLIYDMMTADSSEAPSVNFQLDIPLIEELLSPVDGHMIVGNRTQAFEKLPTLYRCKQRILYLAKKLNSQPSCRIFRYEQYADYYVIDLCAQRYTDVYGHSDIIFLAHPSIVVLTRYDMKNHTNLRDVLYWYLIYNGNLQQTAAAVFMHKNSVFNKIKRIRKLTTLDLDDGNLRQQLIFSCHIITYYEQVLGLKLEL